MTKDYRPLGVGDLVKVLRAARLPIEDSLGTGVIEKVTRDQYGRNLYWISGFSCARTEEVLRRTRTLTELWAEQDEEQLS